MSENENGGVIIPSAITIIRSFKVRQSVLNDEKNIVFSLYGDNQILIKSFELAPASAASMMNILKSGQCGYSTDTEYIYYPV